MPTRAELLNAASFKLAEAVILLAEAGEERLARDAEELAELVEFKAVPFEVKQSSGHTEH